MKIFRLLLIIIVVSLANTANTSVTIPNSLEFEVERADYILHILVTKGEANFYEVEENGEKFVNACGGEYNVNIIESFKSPDPITNLTIGVFGKLLTPGVEYLVFVTDISKFDRPEGSVSGTTTSNTKDLLHPEERKCFNSLPSLRARWETISEISYKFIESEYKSMAEFPRGISRMQDVQLVVKKTELYSEIKKYEDLIEGDYILGVYLVDYANAIRRTIQNGN